jgi:hypothetical protein
MINSNGENIYTNAEIAYELGLSPATVNAVGKRIYGNRIAHWTLTDAQRIVEYIKSISVEEDTKRLNALHAMVENVMGNITFDAEDMKQRVAKDLYNVN